MEITRYASSQSGYVAFFLVGAILTVVTIRHTYRAVAQRKAAIEALGPGIVYEKNYIMSWAYVCGVCSYWLCAIDGDIGLGVGAALSFALCALVYKMKATILAHIFFSLLAVVAGGFLFAIVASL